jgi:hypothetical protein
MKTHKFLRVLKFVLMAVLFIAVLGFGVMRLWNWLMPGLFGLHPIHFWQGVGLLVLSKILFGGFRGRPGGHLHWRQRMGERWEQMTPEERARVRQGVGGRCGSFVVQPTPKA